MTNAFADTYKTNPEMDLPELARRLGVELSDLTDIPTDQATAQEGQGPGISRRALRLIDRVPGLAGLATGFAAALAVHNTEAGPALAIPPILDASSFSPTSPYGFGNRTIGYATGVALSYAPQVVDMAYKVVNGM